MKRWFGFAVVAGVAVVFRKQIGEVLVDGLTKSTGTWVGSPAGSPS